MNAIIVTLIIIHLRKMKTEVAGQWKSSPFAPGEQPSTKEIYEFYNHKRILNGMLWARDEIGAHYKGRVIVSLVDSLL